MSDSSISLFTEEELQRKVWSALRDPAERISIAYVGRAVDNGRIDAVALADGLKGTARLVGRVADMYFGYPSNIFLEVEGEPQSGSIEIFVRIAHTVAGTLRNISDDKLIVGLSVVATLTGFSLRDVGKTLIAVFKKLRGRPIEETTDLSVIPLGLPLDIAEFIRIYNDPEVQAAIRAAARPTRKEGVERFETRSNRRPIETVSKADLLAADAAEMEAIVSDEQKVLDIEKASFLEHLSWHLSDQGKPFDAKIEDPALWERIAAGDRFGYGDRLHVTLHTEAERESSGRLRITRTVTKVHRVERTSGAQIDMFDQT